MTYLGNQNPSIWTRLQRLLNLRTPFDSSPPFMPVVVANSPDAYAEKFVHATSVATSTHSFTFGNVNNSSKDLYITSLMVTQESGLTDISVYSFSAVINGSSKVIMDVRVGAGYPENVIFNPPIPIKVDCITDNITVTQTGASTGMRVTVMGYQM